MSYGVLQVQINEYSSNTNSLPYFRYEDFVRRELDVISLYDQTFSNVLIFSIVERTLNLRIAVFDSLLSTKFAQLQQELQNGEEMVQ